MRFVFLIFKVTRAICKKFENTSEINQMNWVKINNSHDKFVFVRY